MIPAALVEAGLLSPPSSPLMLSQPGERRGWWETCCQKRTLPMLVFWARVLVSLILLTFGIYGLMTGMEDKCTYSGFVTFVMGYWMPSPFNNKVEL